MSDTAKLIRNGYRVVHQARATSRDNSSGEGAYLYAKAARLHKRAKKLRQKAREALRRGLEEPE